MTLDIRSTQLSRRDVFALCGLTLLCLVMAACEQPPMVTATPIPTPTQTPVPEPSKTSTPIPAPTETEVVPPTASPTPVSHITVISPNGGETWMEGETYRIRWHSTGIEQVNIAVATGGKDLGHVALDVDAEAGEYAWTIPQGFVSGFGPSESDTMRIRVYDARDPDLYDENDEFFTVAAP